MTVVRAVYENGVFKPTQPVALPEATEVEFVPRLVNQSVELTFISDPNLSIEEFEKLLDEIAALPPTKVLPPDFSREDIYDDHD
jgi:predicted DNA-binding antitoxin AbrB/MazE fold protein